MMLIKKIKEIIEILKPKGELGGLSFDQREHVAHFVDDVTWRAAASGNRTGMMLMCLVPGEVHKAFMKTPADPYMKELGHQELTAWVYSHLFFDDEGRIVAAHDHGKILWRKEGWLNA